MAPATHCGATRASNALATNLCATPASRQEAICCATTSIPTPPRAWVGRQRRHEGPRRMDGFGVCVCVRKRTIPTHSQRAHTAHRSPVTAQRAHAAASSTDSRRVPKASTIAATVSANVCALCHASCKMMRCPVSVVLHHCVCVRVGAYTMGSLKRSWRCVPFYRRLRGQLVGKTAAADALARMAVRACVCGLPLLARTLRPPVVNARGQPD